MAKPKSKSPKNIDREGKKVSESKSQKIPVSDDVLHIFQESFVGFDKLSQDEKNQRYGDAEYLQQFWKYFAEQNPDLLDRVKEKDLPHYLKQLQDKGFSVKYIVQDSPRLHTKFGSQMTEMQVMQNSLGELHTVCDESKNNFPADLFSRFASFAGFHPTKHIINVDGKLKTLDDLYPLWMNFLEKEGVSVDDTLQKNFSQILVPAYSPIERIMVEVAIQKLKKQLPPKLKTDFVSRFPLPIDIFSSYQDLISFKQEWILFLADHAAEIDKDLAKKLDDVIVTNGDISDALASSKVKFAAAQGSLAGEKYFRQVFDKVAMHQLSEYANKNQQTVDRYLTALATTFKEFPPYINEITKIYPFDHDSVAHVDVSLDADIRSIESQIAATEEEYLAAPVDQQKRLRHKISQLQQDTQARKWQAYVIYLETKDAKLGPIFAQLVDNKFNFPVLSQADQQTLVSLLVEHKLKDVLATKMPEILDVDQESLSTFFKDLFDLSKMDIMIPTRHGNIPISFVKKEFMSSSQTQLPSIADLEGLQNLPLNFVVQVGTSSQSFFEETPIFDSLYTDFKGSNETVRINDAYKVKITKNGQTVEGYLSGYCPCDEYNDTHHDGKALYLYSQPVTSPSQERELVTWPDKPGEPSSPESKIPVVIKDAEQTDCHIDIIERQLNLNGDAIGALLFGYVLGEQTKRVSLSPEKQEALAKQLGKLNVYKDKAAPTQEEKPVAQEAEASKEISAKDKCISARKQLRGYPFPKDTKDGGFVVGSRMFVPRQESELYPKGTGRTWMYFEIVKINDAKGTFTVKFHGGELSLGKSEGTTLELSMTDATFEDIRTNFGDLYKTPDLSSESMEQTMRIVQEAGLATELDKYFGNLKRANDGFSFAMGEDADKKVEYFGRYEPSLGEAADQENAVNNLSLYKIKYHANHTVTLSGEFVDGDTGVKYTRDMDYSSFLIFIKEKGLQPKTAKQADNLKKSIPEASREAPTTKRGFSISNMIGFVKNSFSKIKDSIKKYDDERTEEFTDFVLEDGKFYSQLGKIFSPFGRVSSAFETLGAEHFQERDNRVWKKVEKRKKYYEDSDFGLIYKNYIEKMLDGTLVIKPHYKAAAMLLAMIAKGKGPYNRNPAWAAKGMRVNILMGPEHQVRYLDMRAKLVRELQQGSSQYGPIWIDNKKNEILELEMKYLVHVMDARQLGLQDGDKTKYYFYGKYSHTFIDELEKGYNTFFSQGNVEEIYGKVKGSSFDFARSEFHRLLGDRPQQAIPFLKVMATKAMNESQWKAFEVAVMIGMLSGVFLTMTMSDTQGMIKNCCRTRGFVPGIWLKDINQQAKLKRLLELYTATNFSEDKDMKGVDFTKLFYNDLSGGTKAFAQRSDPNDSSKKPGIFQKWISTGDRLHGVSNFLKLTGKNVKKNTLLDIYEKTETSSSDKALIKEFLENSNEKHEDGDPDVLRNRSALTGSILTQNQSNVHQMMKFDATGFAGKDGDEVQNQQAFFSKMRDAIPKSAQSHVQVKFFMDKFFTRFDEKGFSATEKTELIKRLKWCATDTTASEADKDAVLYYSICGQVYSSLGHITIPQEFEEAMLAWKDFFKNNLSTILTPDMLKGSFGGLSYLQDYEKYTPKLDPRDNCINLLDRDLRQVSLMGLSPEQRKALDLHYKEVIREPYINKKLYDVADRLEKTLNKPNLFKEDRIKHPSSFSSSHRSSRPVATGAHIANPEVLDNLSRILENKPIQPNSLDDDHGMIYNDDQNFDN